MRTRFAIIAPGMLGNGVRRRRSANIFGEFPHGTFGRRFPEAHQTYTRDPQKSFNPVAEFTPFAQILVQDGGKSLAEPPVVCRAERLFPSTTPSPQAI